MLHWHHKQLSCINKIATKIWALLWNEMFVWEFEVGAASQSPPPSCYLVALGTMNSKAEEVTGVFGGRV